MPAERFQEKKAKECLVGRQFSVRGSVLCKETLLQVQGRVCVDPACPGLQDTPEAKTLLAQAGQWWDLGRVSMPT